MATAAAHRLMIKYGLKGHPTDAQVSTWAATTRMLIRSGTEAEAAGASAAKRLFPDFGSHVYASEADTIVSLLEAAESK